MRAIREERAARRAAAVLYVGVMAVGFSFGAWGLPWFVRHAAQLFVTLMGAVFWRKDADIFHRKALVREFGRLYILPTLCALGLSMLYWAIDLRPLTYIRRGCSTVLYALISAAAVCAAVYLFGEKAIDYTLYSMCLANLGVAVYAVRRYGADTFLNDMARFIMSFGVDTGAAAKALEVHDLTFAFGLLALYYLFFASRAGRKKRLAAVVSFFLLGWKLIGALGLAAGVVMYALLRVMGEERQGKTARWLGIAAIFACETYLFAIHSGAFAAVVDAVGLDTRGRAELFAAFQESYRFSPLYRGYGLGYTTRTIELLTQAGGGIFATHNFGGLHNDLLALYIELGFWPFALWLWFCWRGRVRYVQTRFGGEAAQLLLCETAYLFVTCATDNTAFYCYVNTIFMLLPAAYAAGRAASGEEREHE